MLRSLFFLFFVLTSVVAFGQKSPLDVREIKTDKYPEVTGKLWVRNPAGIATDGVSFIENDKPVQVNFNGRQKADSIAKNKQIVFLVRNTSNELEYNWYKAVITQAINSGAIKAGDLVDIVTFSSIIDNHVLFPNEFEFTNNKTQLFDKLENLRNQKRLESNGQAQIHLAINEALKKLEELKIKLPGGIFVLSDEICVPPVLVGETPGPRSLRLNIPIYCLSFKKNKSSYNFEDLCGQTYGRYFASNANSVNEVAAKLTEFLKEFEERHAGVNYSFSYQSTFEKDGKSHAVKITSGQGESAFALLVPSQTFFEWIADNWILCTVLLGLLILMLIIILILVRNNRLKKAQLEVERKRQLANMEEQQSIAQRKMELQDNELRRIRDEELKAAQEAEKLRLNNLQKQEDEVQFAKMLERGNLPWFDYKFGNENGRFQIQTPRLTVGRDESNVWRINHPMVSRRHFQLVFKDYVYTIRDLGSSNGLVVNKRIVKDQVLKDGDCIELGEIILTFHI